MSSSTGTVVFNDSRIKAKGVIATESIGVGTSNPTSNLHVIGDINFTGNLYQNGGSFASSLWTEGDNSLQYDSNVEVGTANLFADTTTGRVGVGTDTPRAAFDINDTGAIIIPVGTTAQQPSSPHIGMLRFNTTNGKLETYDGNAWFNINMSSGISAAGGDTVFSSDTHKIHTFQNGGTFTMYTSGSIEYLIVAGGGAGATTDGGGGGAGGVLTGSQTLSAGSYTIVVGGGGSFVNVNDRAGNNGTNSSAFGFTAIGGGGGGNDRAANQNAKSGGSGGGGGSRQSSGYTGWQGAAGTPGQGYAGGDGVGENTTPASTRHGAGGGGAGEAGKDGNDTADRAGGGDGIQSSISGVSAYYGGGGGGGHYVVGSAGLGGGGTGSTDGVQATHGTAYTGGGGGGGGNSNSRGGNGGSGVVIIRYLL